MAYSFSFGTDVREIIADAQPEVKAAFGELLAYLNDNPHRRQDTDIILEARDSWAGPSVFTASFDHALLTYDISHESLIRLRSIKFLPPYVLLPPI